MPAILNDDISRKNTRRLKDFLLSRIPQRSFRGLSLKKCPGNTVHHGYTIGDFHSTRTQETLETAQMVQKFPGQVSRNPGNGWISEMRTTQPKFLEISASKVEWKKNFLESFSKIWVYHARLSSFMEIFENAALFATGSSRKFNNRSFGWMENAPYFLSKLVVFLSFEICQFHLISHPDLTLFFLPWPRRSGYEIKFHFNQTLENKHRKLSWCK